MTAYKRTSAQRSSRPSSGHVSSAPSDVQPMNTEKTALDALNEYKAARQSLSLAGKLKLGFLLVTFALLSIYGIAYVIAGDKEHAQQLLNIAPVAVQPKYAMGNTTNPPAPGAKTGMQTETTIVIHDHKLSRGALAGIIIGAYIGTGLLCAVRCAACLSCNLAQMGFDNQGVTCCPLFSLFACGCFPELKVTASDGSTTTTPGYCIPGWAPIYWLCPVCWIFGSWGCCTYTPCYTAKTTTDTTTTTTSR